MQMALTLAFCSLLHARFQGVPGLEVPASVDAAVLRAYLLPGVLFVGNIAVGFFGIKLVSIPMFLTVRRTTTIFTLCAEYFVLGHSPTPVVSVGVMLTVLGALVAGSDSLRSDWLGYAFTLCNNALTAASWSATKRFSDQHKLTRFGLTFYNACVALPLCVLLAVGTGEVQYMWNHPHIRDPRFALALFGASSLGVLMNWVTFLAITYTGPLATAVTGNVKDIFATGLGAWIFQDFVATKLKIIGIGLSFLGSAIFSAAKLAEVRQPVPPTLPSSPTGAAAMPMPVEGETRLDLESSMSSGERRRIS
jgi:solute carrier family 35 protein